MKPYGGEPSGCQTLGRDAGSVQLGVEASARSVALQRTQLVALHADGGDGDGVVRRAERQHEDGARLLKVLDGVDGRGGDGGVQLPAPPAHPRGGAPQPSQHLLRRAVPAAVQTAALPAAAVAVIFQRHEARCDQRRRAEVHLQLGAGHRWRRLVATAAAAEERREAAAARRRRLRGDDDGRRRPGRRPRQRRDLSSQLVQTEPAGRRLLVAAQRTVARQLHRRHADGHSNLTCNNHRRHRHFEIIVIVTTTSLSIQSLDISLDSRLVICNASRLILSPERVGNDIYVMTAVHNTSGNLPLVRVLLR